MKRRKRSGRITCGWPAKNLKDRQTWKKVDQVNVAKHNVCIIFHIIFDVSFWLFLRFQYEDSGENDSFAHF